MKIENILPQVPDLTEDKLIKMVDEIITGPIVSNFKILKYRNWSAKEIIDEWDLIRFKRSNLSKSQRDAIDLIVGYALNKICDEIN